jgi:hypothetical protein
LQNVFGDYWGDCWESVAGGGFGGIFILFYHEGMKGHEGFGVAYGGTKARRLGVFREGLQGKGRDEGR